MYYNLVEKNMGFPRHRELEAALRVGNIVECSDLCLKVGELLDSVKGRSVCIVGPLAEPIDVKRCDIVLAPDGGLVPLIMAKVRPLVITTDADSSSKIMSMAFQLSRYIALHVHGDNMTQVALAINSIDRDKLIPTSQVLTPLCILPVGAFTDGDRAVALALELGAESVRVIGFDFDRVSCLHKDLCDQRPQPKLTKLRVAKAVIDLLASELGYAVSHDGQDLLIGRRSA